MQHESRSAQFSRGSFRESRVLIFHNILWAHYKGKVFSELFKLCQQDSISLHVVHIAVSDRNRLSLGAVDEALHQYPYSVLIRGAYQDASFLQKVALILRAVHAHNPDIVVLPGYWDPAFWVLLALAKVEGRKVVLSFDSTKLDHTRHTLLELAKKVFVALCDAGFAYGHRARRYLRELGMPVDRIVIRCQATANEEIRVEFEAAFRERADLLALYGLPARNFCFVGRLSSEKNVLLLIQALESLQVSTQASEGWGLCVVGDGPERPNIEAYCAERRLRAVKFFGGVSWREIPRYLAISDVLVLPSISEPWGLVVNEAMVCGLPVIVSENCGCVEDLVIEGRTGFSFDPHSCANLVKHMRHFVNSPSEIRRIGDAGAHLIRDFSPQAAARQMLSGLNGLLPPE